MKKKRQKDNNQTTTKTKTKTKTKTIRARARLPIWYKGSKSSLLLHLHHRLNIVSLRSSSKQLRCPSTIIRISGDTCNHLPSLLITRPPRVEKRNQVDYWLGGGSNISHLLLPPSLKIQNNKQHSGNIGLKNRKLYASAVRLCWLLYATSFHGSVQHTNTDHLIQFRLSFV